MPPGQFVVDKWPVLSYGSTPHTPLEQWDFRLFGLVEKPIRLTYEQFSALPQSQITADFHCVTTWSMLDNTWEGVLAKDVVSLVQHKPQARFVMIHAEEGYTANLSLDDFLGDVLNFGSPSLNGYQSGGYGTTSGIQLRGLPKRYSTVYIDGVKIGVLVGSFLSAVTGYFLLLMITSKR